MKQKVNYPLFPEWNTEEIIQMCAFYSAVEKAYYKGVQREEFSSCYKNFLKVEPMKMGQKQVEREFKKETGLDIYQVIKACCDNPNQKIIKIKSR